MIGRGRGYHFYPCLLFYWPGFDVLPGLLALLLIACWRRLTLLLPKTPTVAIAFLVCHVHHLLSEYQPNN